MCKKEKEKGGFGYLNFCDELQYKIQEALENTKYKWIKHSQKEWKTGKSETITYFTDKESKMLTTDVFYKNSNYLKLDMAKSLSVILSKGYCFRMRFTKGEKEGNKYLAIDLFVETSKAEIKLNDKNIPCIYASDNRIVHSYIFWDSKKALVNGYRSKFRPCSLKDLKYLPQEFTEAILSIYSGKSNLYKDFIRENVFPPIPLNTLCELYNKRQYLEYTFKIKLPKSVNKRPLNDSYCACCAVKYVPSDQIRHLLEPKYTCNFPLNMSTRERKDIARTFIQDIIKKRNPYWDGSKIYGYAFISMEVKQPIDILVGEKRMNRLTNEARIKNIRKSLRGKKIEIPESPMKYLKLPKNYIFLATEKSIPYIKERKCIKKGQCIGYIADIEDELIYIFIYNKKTKFKNKPIEFSFRSDRGPHFWGSSKGHRIKNKINDAIKAATPKALKAYSKAQQTIIEKTTE